MTRPVTTLAKKKLVVAALEDIKARDIVAIDVRRITAMFDWIVIASADSARQTKALARHVRDKLKEAGCAIIGTEGEEGAEWVLVDSGDIVAHVMQPTVRAYYNLEELWGEGKFDRPANPSVPVRTPAVRKSPAPQAAPRSRTRKAATATKGAAPKPRRRKPAT